MMAKENQSSLWCSQRLLLAFIGFLGSVNLYSMRMNLSVGILCMTNHTAVSDIEQNLPTNVSLTDSFQNSSCHMGPETTYKDGDLLWTKDMRGVILGVFFWGYLVMQIPAGILVHRFSVKWILFGFMMTASLSVILTPLAARASVGFMIALRVICGIASGVWFPCLHQIWSNWSPPKERSILVGITYAGLHVGNAVTLPVAGLLCEHGFGGGWPSIFYLSGLFSFIWCLIWAVFIYDSPEKHPRIGISEKMYIEQSLVGQMDTNESKKLSLTDLPWLSILKSKPFWAIAVINITFDWNGYTFITSTPTYMKDVLKFNMSQNGFASAAPYVGMWFSQIAFALLCDFLQRKKLFSVTSIRKLMNSVGMVIPAIIIIILGYLKCENRYLAVVMLTVGLSVTSALFVGAFVNHVDIAPRYSGLLFGLTNTMGAFTGFFSSYFVQAVTKNNTLHEWRIVFFVCSSIYAVGAIFYLVFGSGDLEPWAIEGDQDNEKMQMMKSDNEKAQMMKSDNEKAQMMKGDA